MKIRINYHLFKQPLVSDYVYPKDKKYTIGLYRGAATINFDRYKSYKTRFLNPKVSIYYFPKIKDLSYFGITNGCNKYLEKMKHIL
jgi:hypothetical protein